MKTASACSIVIMAAMWSGLSARGAIIEEYNAALNTYPTAQGWTEAGANNSANTASVSGGLLHIATTLNAQNRYFEKPSTGDFTFNLATGFAMEGRVMITSSSQNSSPHNGNYPRGGYLLAAEDNVGRTVQVNITSTGFWLATSDGTGLNPPSSDFVTFNTTDALHTYRVTSNGTTVSLAVDGIAAATLGVSSLQTSAGTHNDASFGDGSILAVSDSQTQYFFFSADPTAMVPEPASAGILGAAGILGLLRHRKRPA